MREWRRTESTAEQGRPGTGVTFQWFQSAKNHP